MKNYYDYAASTPVQDYVIKAMQPWHTDNFSNPSSEHSKGQEAFLAIQSARECIANKIGAMPSEIIFTSGATEANNMAIKGIAFSHLQNKGHIITSAIEHKCILQTCLFLESLGFSITYLKPNNEGKLIPEQIEKAIRKDTILISIHHVNNEIGTIQDIHQIGHIAFEHHIPFHTDAAQSFCKTQIDVDDMNIDMLSLSGHKIYAPKGIGVLYVRDAKTTNLTPLIHGGGQEQGLRGGTSPTHLIIGLASAVEHFPTHQDISYNNIITLLDEFKYRKNGGGDTVPSILNITFTTKAEEQRFFSQNKWMISKGSACNAMTHDRSHVLQALSISEEEARRTYRISLPPYFAKP